MAQRSRPHFFPSYQQLLSCHVPLNKAVSTVSECKPRFSPGCNRNDLYFLVLALTQSL